jgi:8-oxo-dGTP pyrophosphatase MutT (NUDIX family)
VITNPHLFQRVRFWAYWPWLFFYFRKGHRARVLVYDGDRILLVKGRWKLWFGDDLWSLPGGGIRSHEQPVEGAAREVNEELGLEVVAKQLRLIGDGQIHEHGLHYHAYFFELQLPEVTKLQLQTSEIADAQWADILSLPPTTLKPEVKRALEVWRP